jgi:hypothetical protein
MFISGVRVFLGTTYPNAPAMVFYVQQELPQRPDDPKKSDVKRDVSFNTTTVTVRSDGRSVLRQHVFRARL